MCDVEAPAFCLDNRLTDGGEVVGLTRPPAAFSPPPPRRFLVIISVTGCVDPRTIVRLEGFDQFKYPMISTRIELEIFRACSTASTNYTTACPPFVRTTRITKLETTAGALL
jgi:hypothetical protein